MYKIFKKTKKKQSGYAISNGRVTERNETEMEVLAKRGEN